jgi:chromosome segregation protein
MRLKRLELYGFKTFADATEFAFDDGITAIIGPNGSGKSNCADALLWVLAERRLSALRAADSADVIFAGSAGRRPLSYAEVTLTVDNADGSLPLDMAEIAVTRRVYRNGEHEYRLNGRTCRRRDVVDLFLDTGVGRPAFSVISQREIDALLSLNPEDRRRLLDEVAGIERYRTQRDETLRRLDDTAGSLNRVLDLQAELRLQVDPLAEQRRVATEYLELRRRFERLKLSLQVKDYGLSQRRLERLREEVAGYDEALTAAAAAVAEAEAGEQTWRLELLALDETLSAARGAQHEAALAVERHESEIRLRGERLAHLQQRLSAATGADERRAAGRAEEEARVAAEQAETERLHGELAAGRTRLDAHREASMAGKAAEDAAEAELTACRAALGELDGRLSGWRSRREAAGETLDTVRARLAALADRGRDAAAELAAATEAAVQAEAAVESANAALTARREGREAASASLAAADRAATEVRRAQADLHAALSERRARLRVLREAAAGYQGLYGGVKAVLKARDEARLRADYHVVASVLTVAEGCDVALEAALGARLQDLICDSGDDARAAIELLKRDRAGRASFLPLDLLEAASPPADTARLRRVPGVVGHALDLVTCDPVFDLARRHLLANLVVVEDLEAGLAVRRAGFARLTIVTRDGDLIRTSGAMSGGSREERGPALLSRKRELDELNAEVTRREARLAAAETAVAQRQAAADAARLAATEAERALETARRAVAEAERGSLAARGALSRAESHAGRLGESEEQWAADVARAEATIAAAGAELDAAGEHHAALAARTAAAEAAWLAARDARRAADEALAAERIAAARLESRLQALAEAAAQRARTREQAAAEEEVLRRERHGWSEEQTRLATELDGLRTALETLWAGERECSAEVEGLRSRHQDLAGRLESGSDALRSARARQAAAQDARHRGELRTAQAVGELAHLEQSLAEDHPGLTMSAAAERAEPILNRAEAAAELLTLRAALADLGDVNVGAIEEYDRVVARIEFYEHERADLLKAREDLLLVMAEIDVVSRERLATAFEAVNREFDVLFKRVFGAEGQGRLAWSDADNFLESGLDVLVQLPGKRAQNLLLLSGGERAMTTITLLLAMFRVKPTPFCLLDELDAPLDEANLRKYRELLEEFSAHSQFIVITHNPETTRAANTLYGITMQEPGVSRAFSHRPPSEAVAVAAP